MNLASRRMMDRSFTVLGILSILVMAGALLCLLGPIVIRGVNAFVFRATVEHRQMLAEKYGVGDREAVKRELAQAEQHRTKIYRMISAYEASLEDESYAMRREMGGELDELKDRLRDLLGPFPGDPDPILMREQYGETRWDRALVVKDEVIFREEYDYSDPSAMGVLVHVPRADTFEGTSLAPLFPYLENHLSDILRPRWTFYWRFFTTESYDAHFFGGIWPEILGTFYLTVGAILFAVPFGVISAIYLVEYANPKNPLVALIRTCISTLAGVPSIVFGLFGLAFFINELHVSESKSVLAGSLTLAVLILPLVIRAAEEAIRAVPKTYKEAALSLGAGRWRTICTVILPAAMPGVLTGIVISMGRAAGETAPIIFTAAVSAGGVVALGETLSQPTPALPWNIYNICSEHEAVNEIRHVQYGMVFTLVFLVLLLNSTAIWLRARIAKRLRGA